MASLETHTLNARPPRLFTLPPPAPPDRFAGNLAQRIREALRPLLAEDATLERTALAIEQHMRRSNRFRWKAPKPTGFLDFQGKVGRIVAHFTPDGLTLPAYLRAAVKQPDLFFLNPETLIHNIEGVADHFAAHGLTRSPYLRGALRQPALFYQKPSTLISNIERVADYFREDGLTCGKYLRAAIKNPGLFCRKPATIIRHVELITDLHRKGLLNLGHAPGMPATDAAPVLKFLVGRPNLFNMSEDNIALREVYAHVTHAAPSKALLRTPRCAIKDRLAEALGLDVKDRDAAIQALIRKARRQARR